jgi:16S rRNA (guanine966-N2)-methyltransferase
MIVIGGKFKGKRLNFIQNKKVRPMTQKVREAIFDILQFRIDGVSMLDLFCGSGAVGIEALSRGAAHVDFIDVNTNSVGKNVEHLGIGSMANIYRRDALKALDIMHKLKKGYDFIFIGAPYDYSNTEEILCRIDEYNILNPNGFLMLEHRKGAAFPPDFNHFGEKKKYTYGQTIIILHESTV